LAVALSLLVTPLCAGHPPADLSNLLVFGKYLLGEALLGVLLGYGVAIFFSGIQLTGQVISQLGGTALSDVFDPTLDTNISVYSQLFYFLTLVMFALLSGHRMLMEALLDTFAWLPPGRASLGDNYVDALTTLDSRAGTHRQNAAADQHSGRRLQPQHAGYAGGADRVAGGHCLGVSAAGRRHDRRCAGRDSQLGGNFTRMLLISPRSLLRDKPSTPVASLPAVVGGGAKCFDAWPTKAKRLKTQRLIAGKRPARKGRLRSVRTWVPPRSWSSALRS
jgi:hypothetical protein